MPAKSKYNSEYHDDWAWSLAIRGATDEEMAEAFGISRRTIPRWRKEHPSFDEAITKGKACADAKVEKSLFQRATGYDYDEVERVIEYDKDGNVKPVKRRTVTKHVPADVGAMCFWLKNRNSDEWSDKPRTTIEIEDIDDTDEAIYGSSSAPPTEPDQKAEDDPV